MGLPSYFTGFNHHRPVRHTVRFAALLINITLFFTLVSSAYSPWKNRVSSPLRNSIQSSASSPSSNPGHFPIAVNSYDSDSNNIFDPNNDDQSDAIIPRRKIDNWSLSDFLLIGTIDGSLHARDRKTGLEMWSVPGETPLVKVSTLESLQERLKQKRPSSEDTDDDDESNITWIVEPLGDGSLYYFLPSMGLQKLPVSIKQLVLESPFLINGDDKIYTGTRSTTLYSINASTGEIIKVYGAGNKGALGRPECGAMGNEDDLDYDEEDDDFRTWKSDGTFMIGRTDYHLEIHNKTEIIWNVTFSTWGPNNMDGDLATQHRKSPDSLYVTPLHENSILALSANTTGKPAIWAGSLPSIAVHIFDVFRSPVGANEPLVLLPQPHYPSEAGEKNIGTYVDRTNDGQWFALSGQNFPSLVRRAPSARWHPGSHLAGGRDNLYQSIIGVHSLNNEIIYSTTPRGGSSVPAAIHNEYLPALPYPSASDDEVLRTRPGGRQNEVGRYYGDGYSYHPRLPPPSGYPAIEGSQSVPTPTYGTWSHFILRLVENVVSVLVIVLVIFVAARLGWLPQIVDFLESMLRIVTDKPRRDPIVSDKAEPVENSQKQENENDKSVAHDTEVTVPKEVVAETISAQLSDAAVEDVKEDVNEVKHESIPLTPDQVVSDAETLISSEANLVSGHATKLQSLEPSKNGSHDVKPKDVEKKSVTISEPEKSVTGDNSATPAKKRKRGSRGGKKGSAKARAAAAKEGSTDSNTEETKDDEDEDDLQVVPIKDNAELILENGAQSPAGLQASPLTVTEETLGYGSQGTVVFKGIFENRDVAVKRMLLNFYDLASQEVTILQDSDDHPNVVRYYCKHQSDQFLYIALELCPGTLEDVIERPQKFTDLVDRMDPIQVLHQIASGLHHLHSLKIVHRDIKPQNILVAPPKKLHRKGLNNEKKEVYGPVRLLISDFGLCKRLEGDQSSFRPTTAQPAGTAGWTAPEISMGGRYPESENSSSSDLVVEWSSSNRRLTRAVDIFSLGCVFYYVLSRGQHPFGVNSKREGNIEENLYSLGEIEDFSELNNPEARDLIEKMISFHPKARPDAGQVLLHPLFWTPKRKLDFLLKVSDRFENDTRAEHSELLELFEEHAYDVVGDDWHMRLDKSFIDSLNKYRKYHGDRMIDLLRAMRNKSHHFNDLPLNVQQTMGPVPEGFLHYFTRRFPALLMTVYYFTKEHLSHEPAFEVYFVDE